MFEEVFDFNPSSHEPRLGRIRGLDDACNAGHCKKVGTVKTQATNVRGNDQDLLK